MKPTALFTACAATAMIVASQALAPGGGRTTASNAKRALLNAPARDAITFERLENPADRRVARPPAAEYVPGRVIVKFAPSVSARTMQVIAEEAGGTRLSLPAYLDAYVVDIPEGADPAAAAATLSRQSGVIYAEPDPVMRPFARPNDPFYQYQWNFQKIDMERAWDINSGAVSSIVVAVIDTGVAYASQGSVAQAPDLAGTRFVGGYDFIWDDREPFDLDGHGTHVTGTIAQSTNNNLGVAGMAYNVSIMPLKALCTDWDIAFAAPRPTGCGGATVARAVRFATDNGAKVINMSLGSTAPSTTLQDAMRDAASRGVFIAIAAGNDGDRGNPTEYPAAYSDIQGVMTVAALDYNLEKSYFSGFKDYVEIAAPGGDTRVDRNSDGFVDGILQQTLDSAAVDAGIFNRFSYAFFQGTSMAAPHVAGFAALLMDQGITSPAAIEAAIVKFAIDRGAAGRDPNYGYGRIAPRETLRGLGLAR